MIEVTESAIANIKEYLGQQNIESSVRIFLMSGGCSGPSLGLALDEAKENDLSFEQEGVSFLVEKALTETCGAIKVDYLEASSSSDCGCSSGGGFSITSEKPLAGGGDGGSCGCSCNGSCG
ncbi:MAG: IscA/HesB family protein [Candidatus Electrothrix aestuarii]|uniref:IscA/HesB family protein n=1 Tax=Candidatus Electrothrix aestuarii TaxID=3062594 RepID=A0AAU8LQQ6_9BACT|nr:IscA/HesB family protein [Candidatus Electrothrix aestuarii]